jgi:hypothetical protein
MRRDYQYDTDTAWAILLSLEDRLTAAQRKNLDEKAVSVVADWGALVRECVLCARAFRERGIETTWFDDLLYRVFSAVGGKPQAEDPSRLLAAMKSLRFTWKPAIEDHRRKFRAKVRRDEGRAMSRRKGKQ